MTLQPSDPSHTDNYLSTFGRRVERIWHPETPLIESTVEGLIRDCKDSDLEACGFIDSDQDYWFVKNVHNDPYHNFLMDIDHAQDTLDNIYNVMQIEVLGIFHSHPKAAGGLPWPSPRDLVGWPDPRILTWRYFIVLPDDVAEWGLV